MSAKSSVFIPSGTALVMLVAMLHVHVGVAIPMSRISRGLADDLRFANGLESISRGQNEDGSVPYQQQASLLQSVKSPFEFDPSVPVGGIIGDYEDADDSVPGLSLCTAPGIDYGGKTFYYICYRSTAQQQSESQNEENYASAERYVKAGEWKDRTMQKLLELLKAAAAEK